MEPTEQNTPQQPAKPAERSVATETVIGGAVGGTIGLITSLFNKKMGRGQQVAIGALAGAGFALAQYMLSNKPIPPSNEPPVTPPQPPVLPPVPSGESHEFALGQIPQILDLLVSRNALTPEQKSTILTGITSGRTGFAGELAIADGFITKDQLNEALNDQATRKAEAAVTDINMLANFGSSGHAALSVPRWLKANWGNNGVNPAAPSPTIIDGASAAANNAQNLVMLAYHEPKDSPLMPLLTEGVSAAANLTRGILQGDSPLVPLSKMESTWRDSMNKALRAAAAAHPDQLKDAKGAPIAIETFITARDAEITTAIRQSLANGNNQGQGQSRA